MYKFVGTISEFILKTKLVQILKYLNLLMCVKDLESETEKGKFIEMEKPEKAKECPLCMDALEFDDKNFYPCTCGYQICRFCWHRIRTNENGLCPACRRIYPENPANFQPLTAEEIQKVKQSKKMKEQQKKQKTLENRKQLANIRVIQKNLVFAVGLPLELSQDNQKKEKVLNMFRHFGSTHKEAITDRTTYAGSQGPSACVYITYQKPEDAVRAVRSLTNTKMEGRTIKVSLGTTKYCSNFLKNAHCPKAECLYLHELADEEASFTKDDIHQGKHLDYEQKLLEQTLNSTSNMSHKINSPSNETNHGTNHCQNIDNCSESSDDVPQNNSFSGSSATPELSPSSNNQNFENNRNLESEVNNEEESNHQNTSFSHSESRTNTPHSVSNSVFRSEENTITNHSLNSTYHDTSNSINSVFKNHVQSNESRPIQQPNFLHPQFYDSVIQNQGQSSNASESPLLRRLSSQNNSITNRDATNSFPNALNMKQEHTLPGTQREKRDDDPDLEFDPTEVSLAKLNELVISERESAAKNYIYYANGSVANNRSPTLPVQMTSDSLGYRGPHPVKSRDPPPGFPVNTVHNSMYKQSFETANSVLSKPQVLENNILRAMYSPPRYMQLGGVSINNSSFTDYSPRLQSREVQPSMYHPNHRLVNLPQQAQFPVTEQRSSPSWNTPITQPQWRPVENPFLNQSLAENRVSNDFNLRLQHLRSNEANMRQWQQHNGNVNLPTYQDMSQTMTSEQLAKVNAMLKAQLSQRNSGMAHRLQYTKKL